MKIDAPPEGISNEYLEPLHLHKAEIIKRLTESEAKVIRAERGAIQLYESQFNEPDPLRDFCAVCRSLLFELPNGEWICSTDGCTEKRVNEAKRFLEAMSKTTQEAVSKLPKLNE